MLALLTTTFSDPDERGRAFAIYGAIAGVGGALGLLLGGILTSYASWRWTLFVNLVFALSAVAGAAVAGVVLKRGTLAELLSEGQVEVVDPTAPGPSPTHICRIRIACR